jgi:hypothetical protein
MGKLWHSEETKMGDHSFTLYLHYSIFPTLRPHPKGGIWVGKTDFFCRRVEKMGGNIFFGKEALPLCFLLEKSVASKFFL